MEELIKLNDYIAIIMDEREIEGLKNVLKLIDEEIKERELEINTTPKNEVAVLSRNISIAIKNRLLKLKQKIQGE